MAIRTHDVLRQIAIEHELDIITGKVASDHVHMFISSDPGYQQDRAMVERHKLADLALRICSFDKAILGQTSLGASVPCGKLRQHH